MNLLIDLDFQNILPPLSNQEYIELEKSVKEKGVLSPILVWNGFIVDGHNRYKICKSNGITDFPIKEVDFNNKDEVLEWILSHQLGRRNLTDFQRNEVALKYQDVIAKRMKDKQAEYYGNRFEKVDFGSNDHKSKEEPTTTRKELSKIAGTSESSIKRTKYILENGTEEQIERARKGGGGNSIGTIEREIRESVVGTKKCPKCGKTLPISEFYSGRNYCKRCHNQTSNKCFDLKGNRFAISDQYKNLTEEEIIGDLYDTEKDIGYNADDLREELSANIQQFKWSVSNTLEMHRDLLLDEVSRNNILGEITQLQKSLEEIKTLYGCE